MSGDALKAWLRLGVMLMVLSGFVLALQDPGSAGFVVSAMSLCIGGVLVGLVALLLRAE